ncbi:unnamed protein product, partial [Rotaria sp. Silwood2]
MLRFKLDGLVLDESITDGPFYETEIVSLDKLHLLSPP